VACVFETVGNKDVVVKPTWMADICSCNICTSDIHVGRIHGMSKKYMPQILMQRYKLKG
jgi:hypothetical protein